MSRCIGESSSKIHELQSIEIDYINQYPEIIATESFQNCRNLNVYVVGDVGNPNATVIRVVHISDTRGTSDSLQDHLPNGHILIHSGDFSSGPPVRSNKKEPYTKLMKVKHLCACRDANPEDFSTWEAKVGDINTFFQRQPHPFKIFIPGCWDYFMSDSGKLPPAKEIQKQLPSAIYLEDSWCQVFGLKIYGIPWTSADELRPEDGTSCFKTETSKNSFSNLFKGFRSQHLFSSCISNPGSARTLECMSDSQCVAKHKTRKPNLERSDGFILPDIISVEKHYDEIPHDTDILVSHMPAWRPEIYSKVVGQIKPLLHLFGHDFSGYGVTWRHGTVFSNASLQLTSLYPRIPIQCKESYFFSTSDSLKPMHSYLSAKNAALVASSSSHMSERAKFLDPNLNSIPEFIHDSAHCQFYQRRPRRWRRRLSHFTSRLLFTATRPFKQSSNKNFGSYSQHYTAPRIKNIPSSIASQTLPPELDTFGGKFIYEPCVSLAGGNNFEMAEYSRRGPLVFDVYVVIEDDKIILPDYNSEEPLNENQTDV